MIKMMLLTHLKMKFNQKRKKSKKHSSQKIKKPVKLMQSLVNKQVSLL